jgi:hypothetical protein
MSKNDRLGPVVRAIVAVNPDHLGVIGDIVNRLNESSADAPKWHARCKRMVEEGLTPKPRALGAPAIHTHAPNIIKPQRPFDPAAVFGEMVPGTPDWSVWRGPENGDGLTGEIECDLRSLVLEELDLSAVRLETCLRKEETHTAGAERIRRLIADEEDQIRLDPSFALALRSEPSKYPDKWKGVEVFWDGLICRFDCIGARRCTVSTSWRNNKVQLYYRHLTARHDAETPSALLGQ